jgi:hypothetical protein
MGPFIVIDVAPHGAITIKDDEGKIDNINGQRLKNFREASSLKEKIDTIDLVDFSYFD